MYSAVQKCKILNIDLCSAGAQVDVHKIAECCRRPSRQLQRHHTLQPLGDWTGRPNRLEKSWT